MTLTAVALLFDVAVWHLLMCMGMQHGFTMYGYGYNTWYPSLTCICNIICLWIRNKVASWIYNNMQQNSNCVWGWGNNNLSVGILAQVPIAGARHLLGGSMSPRRPLALLQDEEVTRVAMNSVTADMLKQAKRTGCLITYQSMDLETNMWHPNPTYLQTQCNKKDQHMPCN